MNIALRTGGKRAIAPPKLKKSGQNQNVLSTGNELFEQNWNSSGNDQELFEKN